MAAAKLAKQLGPGHRVVTLLCDRWVYIPSALTAMLILTFRCSGTRHLSKFWASTDPVSGSEDLMKENVSLDNVLGL